MQYVPMIHVSIQSAMLFRDSRSDRMNAMQLSNTGRPVIPMVLISVIMSPN